MNVAPTVEQDAPTLATMIAMQQQMLVALQANADRQQQAIASVMQEFAGVAKALAARDVNVTNEVQPAAVSVELPARKTVTEIERDSGNNIVRATQTETTVD